MFCSVAMSTYNGERFLAEQLSSICAQTRPVDEIVVSDDGSSDGGSYLELMYVRKDEQGSYVMKANDQNKLEKQYIATGKTVWGSMVEIRGGLTMDDRIAFPYGKTVKEGAPVIDADYPSMY